MNHDKKTGHKHLVSETIEEMIQRKGLNAPRINPTIIESSIKDVYFHIAPNTTLTFCVLTLKNGFQVTGESAAASLENFDKEIGEKIAKENAKNKIWSLMGFLLKDSLVNDKCIELIKG